MLTDDAVVAYKKNLLSETHGKSVEELERLLQDWGGCLFDSCQKHTVGHFEDTDAAIAEHPGAHELDSFAMNMLTGVASPQHAPMPSLAALEIAQANAAQAKEAALLAQKAAQEAAAELQTLDAEDVFYSQMPTMNYGDSLTQTLQEEVAEELDQQVQEARAEAATRFAAEALKAKSEEEARLAAVEKAKQEEVARLAAEAAKA
ncbi:unnamed protein product, partial [Durusdinium trenchii]